MKSSELMRLLRVLFIMLNLFLPDITIPKKSLYMLLIITKNIIHQFFLLGFFFKFIDMIYPNNIKNNKHTNIIFV